MAIVFTCSCGKRLTAPDDRTGQTMLCPDCGVAAAIPALGKLVSRGTARSARPLPTNPTRWRLWLAAAILLFAGAGAGIILTRTQDAPEEETAPVLPQQRAEPKRPPQPQPSTEPVAIEPRPPQKEQVAAAPVVKVPADIAGPVLKIDNVAPKLLSVKLNAIIPPEPRAGQSLTIRLEAEHPGKTPLAFEYRRGGEEPWEPAPQGRVELKKLAAGLLVLEFRAQDAERQTSPILRHTILVKTLISPKNTSGVAEPGKPPPAVVKLKSGDTFFQELLVTQMPTFKVQGLPVASLFQYGLVSRLDVDKARADGGLIVRQKVEQARLIKSDALTQNLLAGPLAKLPGTGFTLHLNSKREVTQLEGLPANNVQLAANPLLGGQGVQMASLLDRDGWKELAQTTFFQPERLAPGARWSRPLTHQWGALGAWSGLVHYGYTGRQGSVHQIAYTLQLGYQPPRPGNAPLPFQVNAAAFQLLEGAGVLYFDADKGRVVSAEERFRVRGAISINLLGTNTPVEVEEEQLFQLRVLDEVKTGK